jgi:general secretion pathway protein I
MRYASTGLREASRLSHSTPPENNAGFTLIEALVALAIIAAVLASVGSLIGTTAHGARSIEDHLARLETARSIMGALPARDQLAPGTLSGEIADHRWWVDVLPFASQAVSPQSRPQWVPQAVVITIKSANGTPMKIDTLRLQRVNAK